MNDKIAIHHTAFIPAAIRASDAVLSRDYFAHLWSTSKTAGQQAKYAGEDFDYEPLPHCLRNRYFVEKINGLEADDDIEVLINFGSGFSMYPFPPNKSLQNIEIDLPFIVAYKKEMPGRWQAKGLVPTRDIHFLTCDFANSSEETGLCSRIKDICSNGPSFILAEGVLFFLEGKDAKALFAFFARLQKAGD